MDRDDLPAHFEWFADWCVGTSPLYERLARGVVDDLDLLDLAADRDLYWVSGHREADEYEQAIELVLRTGDDREAERLGVYEQHGEWIAWGESE